MTGTHPLLEFIGSAPTPFHATRNMARQLEAAGFLELQERDAWHIEETGRYYVIRGGSSIIAFVTGNGPPAEHGIRMVGAHTDSPCLKIKPRPESVRHGYLQLGVEVYGGALLHPWFDRDLSIAGRVTYETTKEALGHCLLDYRSPIAVIPSLAIHLNRDVNQSNPINPQTQLPPVLLRHGGDECADFRELLLIQARKEHPRAGIKRIVDYELCLYDTQEPSLLGLESEFVAGARLDNLVSCFAGLNALLAANPAQPCLLVCNDHEEVGSQSAIGAQGPFLDSLLRRWCGDDESYQRAIHRSMLISADNAHGIHPNYPSQHERGHRPRLGDGPVIKVNHNQRYATNSETSAIFRRLCDRAKVPVQHFVTRSDLACGSTIGPLTAAQVGVRTLDVGVAQFAMHSIRELCAWKDIDYLTQVLGEFYGMSRIDVS